uniref:4-dimethylallyltryptophan N-methyltransferase n=1 Tax=Epichloe funkii TaxID=447255 RepID=R9VXW8_9HYPO|nr:dimethylallyltryptophan N-methyltransferase [Epichloe funkii]
MNKPNVLDIRLATFEDSIVNLVINGLRKQPKTLPALLFYTNEGLKHWNHHSHQPEFYPRHQEVQILKNKAQEMAASIPMNSVVVDLGSASLDKVIHLLEALEVQKKDISYYALDVSASQLESTLAAIPTQNFRHVRYAGLHGTFDDGLHWLKEAPEVRDLPHTVLLFGLTIGNFSRPNAAAFLSNIGQHAFQGRSGDQCSILMSLDSCKVPTQVLRAYTCEGVVPFALQSLTYANNLFGGKNKKQASGDVQHKFFNPDEWYYLSEWNFVLGRHEASLIPRSKDIELPEPLDGIVVGKDEKVRFGCSYKYDQEERMELFAAAGMKNEVTWSDEGCDVAFYELKLS